MRVTASPIATLQSFDVILLHFLSYPYLLTFTTTTMESDLCKRVYSRFLSLDPTDSLIVKASRRSGKTQLVCALAASLAPTHRVCILTSCKADARRCARKVATLLPGCIAEGEYAVLSATGGWVECGTRVGRAPDVLLIDDAQLMDPSYFFDTIVPLICTKRVLLIGTPTGNAQNILARLSRMRETFNYVIDTTQRGAAL